MSQTDPNCQTHRCPKGLVFIHCESFTSTYPHPLPSLIRCFVHFLYPTICTTRHKQFFLKLSCPVRSFPLPFYPFIPILLPYFILLNLPIRPSLHHLHHFLFSAFFFIFFIFFFNFPSITIHHYPHFPNLFCFSSSFPRGVLKRRFPPRRAMEWIFTAIQTPIMKRMNLTTTTTTTEATTTTTTTTKTTTTTTTTTEA